MPLVKATLTKLNASGSPEGELIEAQFNPTTLQVMYRVSGPTSLTRPSTNSGSGEVSAASTQRTGFSQSLSSFQLLFDTTETGEDVRASTLKVVRLMQAENVSEAPRVRFQWGSFLFEGTVNSVTESLEYFSEGGVPLRATVSLSMSRNDRELASPGAGMGSGGSFGFGAGAGASAGFSAGISAGVSAGIGSQCGNISRGRPQRRGVSRHHTADAQPVRRVAAKPGRTSRSRLAHRGRSEWD